MLESTITQLRTSTFPFEIIVSDGGSTDDTLAIAHTLADRVVANTSGTRQNIAIGRNAGARVARGAFLLFLDADVTIPDPDTFLTSLIQLFEHEPDVVACTTALRVSPNAETLTDAVVFTVINTTYYICNNILGVAAASGEVQCMRTSTFMRVGGFAEHIVAAEDQEMFRRLRTHGQTRFVSSLTAYHTGRRMHATGLVPLMYEYGLNHFSVLLFGKSVSKEWKPIR